MIVIENKELFLKKYIGYHSLIENETPDNDPDLYNILQEISECRNDVTSEQIILDEKNAEVKQLQLIAESYVDAIAKLTSLLHQIQEDIDDFDKPVTELMKYDDIISSFYTYGIISKDFEIQP